MLKGKTVLITGGTKGIGKEIALEFAREGANIVINYLSTNPEKVIKEIESYGSRCIAYKGDISNFNEAEKFIKTAKETFDSVDVLVNNAGITKDNLIIRMKEEEFDNIINTNLKGTFNTIRHASPIMIKQKSGSIVNISSIVGVAGNIGQANYSASKAGIIGLTKSIAKELASRNITCNAIAPGFIETDMTSVLQDKVREFALNSIPLKRFGNVNEVAKAVVFLTTNTYITGEVLHINGGMYM